MISSATLSGSGGSAGVYLPKDGGTARAYDAVLVDRFKAGDAAAFDEMVSRHWGKIYSTVNLSVRNHEDAEEITSDTFIRAHRALVNFRGDCALATWLCQIANNLACNRYWYWRRRKRDQYVPFDTPVHPGGVLTFADTMPAEEASADECAKVGDMSRIIAVCMERLPRTHREILVLRNVLHRPYEDIGRTLGIGVGTVKSRIARARENLRTLVEVVSQGEMVAGAHRSP